MNSYYILIPINNLTLAMKNRAKILSENYLRKVIIDEIEYYVVEINKNDIKYTDLFDSYKWYECFEIKPILPNIDPL